MDQKTFTIDHDGSNCDASDEKQDGQIENLRCYALTTRLLRVETSDRPDCEQWDEEAGIGRNGFNHVFQLRILSNGK